MLHLDPKKRISAADALKHPYFHSHPLPTDPADFPDYHGDFHEYTVRKDKSMNQNAQRDERKKEIVNGRLNGNLTGAHEENRVGGKRPRSRGSHHPVSHKYTKPPQSNNSNYKTSYHKNVGFEKHSRPYEKSSELHLAGMKRNHSHMEVPKPKEADQGPKKLTISMSNGLKDQVTEKFLSLIPKEERDAYMVEETSTSRDPTMASRENIREKLTNMKRRDQKSDQKDKGRE